MCEYKNVRRLYRHYVRAKEDPAVAIRWTLGVEKKSWREPKTNAYQHDQNKGKVRQMERRGGCRGSKHGSGHLDNFNPCLAFFVYRFFQCCQLYGKYGEVIII